MTLSTRVDPRVRFPEYALPQEIAHYSKDNEKNVILDNRQLKFLRMPPPGTAPHFDCLVGSESFGPLLDFNGIDSILKWACKTVDKENSLRDLFRGAEFVTYRGIYCKIGLCPYENREPLIIVATKYRGIVFMGEYFTPEKEAERANEPLVQQQASYAGYKFEGYVTSPNRHGGNTCADEPVNPKEQYCCAFRGKINGKRIFMVAEVDCVDPQTNEHVELKTQRQLQRGSRQEVSFKRFKCLRVWLQSYLVGVKNVIFGLRDDNFVVREFFSLPTSEFPRFARTEVPPNMVWEPAVCLTFIDRFLDFVKLQLARVSDLEYFRFEFNPYSAVFTVTPEPMENRHFMHSWFCDAMESKFG